MNLEDVKSLDSTWLLCVGPASWNERSWLLWPCCILVVLAIGERSSGSDARTQSRKVRAIGTRVFGVGDVPRSFLLNYQRLGHWADHVVAEVGV